LMLLFTMMPMQAFAEKPEAEAGLKYLNIGDSIAAGLSALPDDYFALYAGYLGEDTLFRFYTPIPELQMPPYTWSEGAINLGFPGLDSMELLKALRGEIIPSMTDPLYALQLQMLNLIPQADIITISIGGNNLLTPVIATVFGMYGLTPGLNDEEDLLHLVNLAGEDVWNQNLQIFESSVLYSTPSPLGIVMQTRSTQFISDWTDILEKIEDLNSDAQIIAMTLYNPIEKEDHEALFERYEALVGPMNMAIKDSGDDVLVADVAEKFMKKPDAVAFRLTWLDEMPRVLVDPHPTTLGHKLIFKEIKKLGNPMSF